MKRLIEEKIEIPHGFVCKYENKIFSCKKDSVESLRKIDVPNIEISIENNKIYFRCKRATKKEKKIVNSFIKHINNFFQGLNEKFVYKLELCNVHFPMTLKIDKDMLIINNFLGEKTPRHARILSNVDVQIKGQSISLSSFDKEAAGQTAGNIESATKVRNRDRRIFQDGIYIVSKPGDEK